MPSASIEISNKLLGDVISTAFDGGSVGWCVSAIHNQGRFNNSNPPWYAQASFWGDGDLEIEVTDCDGEVTIVTYSSFRKNFKLFSEKYPTSLARIKDEQYDAIDADRLWQFIVFGEMVYG